MIASERERESRHTGIPSATNIDHVGITVPDLDEAIRFFTEVLGADLVWRVGGVEDPHGDSMTESLNVHPRASMDVAVVRCGPTMNVELFEYRSPDQSTETPKNSDHGASHLAFYVSDMLSAVAYLREQPGVRLLGEPRFVEEGPTKGQEWVYFLAPWGLQMELIRWPRQMPYEAETDARLYGPEPTWKTGP